MSAELPYFLEFLQLTSKHTCCECTKLSIMYILIVNLKLKFKLIETYAVIYAGVCLLKILLNLYNMYRYSSGTTTLPSESLIQSLSSKRERISHLFWYIRASFSIK